jgi:hypothetical protein
MEEWRIVEGFTEYEVSNMGNVRRGSIIWKQWMHRGYLKVVFKHINIYIHRLVALAFIPNPENKPTIDHIDRNKLNNRVENLRWATHSEQVLNRDMPTGKTNERCIVLTSDNTYRVGIKRNYVYVYRKCFNNLPEAINARDAFLATL